MKLFKSYLTLIALFPVVSISQVGDSLVHQKESVKMDILYGYYQQDGNNSPVTGGAGTEELDNHAPMYQIYIPLKDSSNLGVQFGVDHYTSASTLNINRYVSSASTGESTVSGKDTRIHSDISYSFLENGISHGLKTGFSTEYDVLSFNFGYDVSIPLKRYGQSISFGINTYWDRWLLIYPGEFETVNGDPVSTNQEGGYGSESGDSSSGDSGGESGEDSGGDSGGESGEDSGEDSGGDSGGESGEDSGEDSGGDSGSGSGSGDVAGGGGFDGAAGSGSDGSGSSYGAGSSDDLSKTERYNSDWRKTFAFNAQHNITINRRMKMASTISIVYQNGLLSTPFHRVYFNDGVIDETLKLVRVENLPRQKIKFAATVGQSIFVTPALILKPSVRLYYDSWSSAAISADIEAPIKLSKIITFYPFYRFHIQSASTYFNPYGETPIYQYYATSDYDLSAFSAHKFGLGIQLNPLYGITIIKSKKNVKSFVLDKFNCRIGSYRRSTNLTAQFITFGLSFKFDAIR